MTWASHYTSNTAQVVESINSLVYPGQGTFTAAALAEADAEPVRGRPGAKSVVIIVTDGEPTSWRKTAMAANSLKDKAQLIWVPVGQNLEPDTIQRMRSWASEPPSDNVLEISTLTVMDSDTMINNLVSMWCSVLQ